MSIKLLLRLRALNCPVSSGGSVWKGIRKAEIRGPGEEKPMEGKNEFHRKAVMILLSFALAVLGFFSLMSVERLQGNARVINYAGVVRGATQKLVKKELQGKPDDALIARLDGIIGELLTGEGEIGLIRLNDDKFQELMGQMQVSWSQIKNEIEKVRRGEDSTALFELSEAYFDLADRTVAEAELYTERNAALAEKCYIIVIGIFAVTGGFLVWLSITQNRRRKELQKAEDDNRRKSEYLSRMSKEIQVPINEISELIYVSDMENYDLLFVNEAGRRDFHIDEVEGLKCYRSIRGRETPCPNCTNELLRPGETYNWEGSNPVTNRHYMFKDRMIEWDGRKARLEIAFDTTLVENEKQKLQYTLDGENMVVECIRILYQGHDLNQDVRNVLERVGTFFGGERTYIFSIPGDFVQIDSEWCAPGLESWKEKVQKIPLSMYSRWLSVLNRQECVVIEDLECYRESSPKEYELLVSQGIRSLVAAPLEHEGRLVGGLCVDNPPIEKLWNVVALLQTLCYFILLAYRRAHSEQQLSHLSFYDMLTSFYNRNRYMQDLEVLPRLSVPVGIVYLDVNGLKEVNDQYGHSSGDKLLVRASEKILTVFGEADCYRIGGDEFVILQKGIEREQFEAKVMELKMRFKWDESCNAAIGSDWIEQSGNIEQAVSNADTRMYEDKKEFYRKNSLSGHYRHRNDEVLHLANPHRLQEEISRQQFVVYLQPKISSSDRRAVGAEALIRYQSRDGSLILPGNFLPLLEEAKSISLIDFYVFEFICSKLKAWSKEGKKSFPVSVNFSRYSLIQPSFIHQLKEICRKYEISPTNLEIEITESVRDVERDNLSRLILLLRQEGFGVTIDDFGTEYANLSLLSSVEFDVLKLDRSMVADVANNPKTRAIIKNIADGCRADGIQLVAEGIENEEQLETLRACGVELVQGFLFSKPIPIEEYEKQYL